jgi:hypothetical protein
MILIVDAILVSAIVFFTFTVIFWFNQHTKDF